MGLTVQSHAQESSDHVKVALRMIGHQLLLQSNDSTSRVLPIKYEHKKFRINFESAFGFIPDKLINSVDSIFYVAEINDHYRLEVENTDLNEVVYSFEVAPTDSMIPCGPRPQPKANYSLLVSFLDNRGDLIAFKGSGKDAEESVAPEKLSSSKGILTILIILGLLFIAGIYFLIVRNRKKEASDHTYIGKYQFDQRNMKLIFKKESIELTSKETDLLSLLHSSMDQTIEREKILKVVWGDEGDYVGRTLDVFISKLRKKFSGDDNVKIVNVRGVGYKLMLSEV
ncbi:MAG: winged helix-turn-helix domain-containing protein [Crocinitomicaceae bacterium]